MAVTAGIDFQHPQFLPVDLADAEGGKHTFCFATRLNGDRISIEAYEETADPGYRFQVVGEAELVSGISEEDIKTEMEQANCNEEKAKEALEKADGDIAKAILDLQS